MSIYSADPSRVGKRGTVVIPAPLRRRFGIEEGTLVIAEARDDGILIRPAVALPVEVYTPERKAEFILSGAIADHLGELSSGKSKRGPGDHQ